MKYTGRRENDFSVYAYMYLDRDIDLLEHRRQPRPVAQRRIPKLDRARGWPARGQPRVARQRECCSRAIRACCSPGSVSATPRGRCISECCSPASGASSV
jgi:hypothetical protein